VERAGLAFEPLVHGAEFDPLAHLPADQVRVALLRVFFDDGYGQDLRAAVARRHPDVTVIDCLLLGAQAAAESLGGPYALLMHTLPGYLRDRFALADLNAIRAQAGLAPVDSGAELWRRAARTLVTSTPLLDDAAAAILPGLQYVGPIFGPPVQEGATAFVDLPRTDAPLVLAGFSTTFMDQEGPLARLMTAASGLPVQLVVTAGPVVDRAALPAAPNVAVYDWLPHAAVLPRTALVVTHAGHGTVALALSHGVPVLCVPLGRDQGFIARRVQELGAGLVLAPDATHAELRTAIMTLLTDESYREAARRLAVAIRTLGPGADNAAAELEAIHAASAP
jgi:UDP:flavonoid glycosyltransferase YjiC (YdhE family)